MEININPVMAEGELQTTTVDLAIFMGQSNMAGRGVASEAPHVPKGYGYEFRAVSNPTKLYDIVEPFGLNENNILGINEPNMKTGSLVSAFVIAYYDAGKMPIVGVSASKGGSSINEWQPEENYFKDAVKRFKSAQTFLCNNGYEIRKKFMVWCQGETDGDNNMQYIEYKRKLQIMMEAMFDNGIEKSFVICIGNHRDKQEQYREIIKAQKDFCKTYENVIMVSDKFIEMAKRGLMKDAFHYKQAAYNEVGTDAGKNASLNI